ncbi:hypothetical protein P3X46_010889 [Hevea brasiliensis]|uniref:Uncharacterized protein n=1 Tax=Hevea brasiliensis TaxID=3981 RepID=A0ABQ9MJB4_HEVBR|nr:uncharacterized protein LOC110635868 [Hevea brasiliensis]KAJ9179065.1 hypothetical protein P3X46_010889 [Hevea brasiliensis]
MASSRKWAAIISFFASWFLFLIILFQVSLFRVPCRTGICTSPIEVTSSQLIATEICPAFFVQALLYPGAIAKAFRKNRAIPSYDNLLKIYNLTNLKKDSAATDLYHLEILAGSYMTVAGALLGLVRPGRMSFFGTLLIIWGFVREGILRKSANMNPVKTFHIYPAMFIAVLFAALSIRKDVRKLIRCSRARRAAKAMRSKAKHM